MGICALDFSRVTDSSGKASSSDCNENERATSRGMGRTPHYFHQNYNKTRGKGNNGSHSAVGSKHPLLPLRKPPLAPHNTHILITPVPSLEINEDD